MVFSSTMKKIAIAGAAGFVGSNLIPQLSKKYSIRALGRSARKSDNPQLEWKQTELFSTSSTVEALKDIDVAIYLVHSMMPSSRLFQGDFHDTDLLLADNFSRACKKNNVKQIIYLGGLVPEGYISPHLQSRQEVEDVLKDSGIPVTVLRAGMIVGPGGSSFEILRSLVKKLPWMILPKWTQSATQAIFIDDVLSVIAESIENESLKGKTLNVVNGESLTYEAILRQAAQVFGLKRRMLPVPIASTGFSKLWVSIFGRSSYELVSPLIDSLLCDLPQLHPPQEIAGVIRYSKFTMMIEETMKRDSTVKIAKPVRKTQTEDSVRSIQRLPSVPKDCHWIATEYMRWLPHFFPAFLTIHSDYDNHRIEFRFTFLQKPLLVLEFIKESFEMDREKFHIVGGLLTRTTNTGWLEFRQVEHKKYLLASIHEFVPRLPWYIYIFTQAPLHKFVMKAFGRHLKNTFHLTEDATKVMH
jgi:uncharacterized protein YbjT (DUF2867 family)